MSLPLLNGLRCRGNELPGILRGLFGHILGMSCHDLGRHGNLAHGLVTLIFGRLVRVG